MSPSHLLADDTTFEDIKNVTQTNSHLNCNCWLTFLQKWTPQANVFGEMASSYEEGGGGGKPYVDKVHFNVSDGVTDLTIGAPGPDILAKSRQIRTNTYHTANSMESIC